MFSPEYDQLASVDKDCTKDEEEVNEDPTGQGGYALGHLSYKAILGFHAFSGCQIYWSICHTLNKVPTQWHFFVSINSTISALGLFTSGEDDMVETRRAVNDRNRVTSIPILPGTI